MSSLYVNLNTCSEDKGGGGGGCGIDETRSISPSHRHRISSRSSTSTGLKYYNFVVEMESDSLPLLFGVDLGG